MTRTETIIAVKDVTESSKWYQEHSLSISSVLVTLECKSSHGGDTFEILSDKDGTVILCLHKWGEHNHPTMANPASLKT